MWWAMVMSPIRGWRWKMVNVSESSFFPRPQQTWLVARFSPLDDLRSLKPRETEREVDREEFERHLTSKCATDQSTILQVQTLLTQRTWTVFIHIFCARFFSHSTLSRNSRVYNMAEPVVYLCVRMRTREVLFSSVFCRCSAFTCAQCLHWCWHWF